MRLVPSDPRENSCFTLISRWMDQCTKHSDCSPPVPVELPKRVIEIPVDPLASPKLRMTNGALGRYVILSHCWGTRGLTTLTNSLLPHYQEGIRPELLPNSFRDAIEITRRLGFQYLWIDALCIIQNDAEDWAEEAAKMASYYGLSTLMISATAAEDSSRGILKPRDALRSPILGIRKRFFLCQDLLRSGIEIDRSVLATRGWAAQERMLAPRVLHYTKQQMIWECAEGLFCEAFSDTRVRSAARAGYCKAKCQQFVTEALSQENTVPRYQDHNAKMQKRSFESISLDRIETWHQCVGMYSSRSLTVPTDKLHAIAGVARMLNHSGQLGGYLAGIWSMRLAVSLAWKKESEMLSSPPSYTAPSWSWAGVEGEVKCGFDYPQTPCDDADKSWAKRWYPKLTEQHMILQNEHNIYGAVLEGSYITVEGACLALADLGQFLREVDRIYSRNLPFHSHRILLDREDWLYDPATYDCCMYLIGVPAHDGFIDLLLLSWLDREASVAQRVGIAEIRPRRVEEDREPLFSMFEAANWERRTLKLV
jgi:hypothetical protein